MIESKIVTFRGMPLFQKATIEPNFTFQGELKDTACFFYILNGKMVSYDSRGSYQTTKGNAILKSCGKYIQRYFAQAETKCEAIAVFLYEDLIKEIYKDEVPYFMAVEMVNPPKKFIGNQLVEEYMNNISLYFEEPDAMDDELGILKLKELILILLKSENHQGLRQLLSEIFTPVNLELKKVVENNLYNNLTIEQLAYISNMSLSKFKREFKKVYNETPARYIKQQRLLSAERRLLTSTDGISDIAYTLGFEDISTFSASFKEMFGVSPSKFRLNQNQHL